MLASMAMLHQLTEPKDMKVCRVLSWVVCVAASKGGRVLHGGHGEIERERGVDALPPSHTEMQTTHTYIGRDAFDQRIIFSASHFLIWSAFPAVHVPEFQLKLAV